MYLPLRLRMARFLTRKPDPVSMPKFQAKSAKWKPWLESFQPSFHQNFRRKSHVKRYSRFSGEFSLKFSRRFSRGFSSGFSFRFFALPTHVPEPIFLASFFVEQDTASPTSYRFDVTQYDNDINWTYLRSIFCRERRIHVEYVSRLSCVVSNLRQM